MTEELTPGTGLLPVEQTDREAAANQFVYGEDSRARILVGREDEAGIVQAFVRHRLAHTEPLLQALQEAREAIRLVVEGGAMTRAKPWRNDGKPSKSDRCPHDKFMYEACENCTDAVLYPVLTRINTLLSQGKAGG